MITAIWTTVLLVASFLLLAWQLGKDKGKEQGYFEGYKKGFSDAKFLSKMEHKRQYQLEIDDQQKHFHQMWSVFETSW